MKRRGFLQLLGAALGSAAAGTPRPALAWDTGVHPSMLEGFQQWTWVHGGGQRTPGEWQDRFSRLAQAGFTGVLVGGGDTAVLADAAHASGLEFHRWIWTLNRNGDSWVRENHPEWFTVSRDGKSSLTDPPYVDYYRWLCPTRPEVRGYLTATITDVARDPRVDGIHLDYIRHCDVILPRGLWSKYDLVQDREYPPFDFCYCQACREAYSAQSGMDPLDLPDPTADSQWRRFRWDSVTGLVRELARAVHGIPPAQSGEADGPTGSFRTLSARSSLRPLGSGKPISAAVFPTPSIARTLVRQAWDEWPLDAFFPMLYHEFYEEDLAWIGRGVEEGLRGLEDQNRSESPGSRPGLYAGLYLPTLNRDGTRKEAVEVAREAGAQGVSFFEMNGLDL